jgi:hypothetical protein
MSFARLQALQLRSALKRRLSDSSFALYLPDATDRLSEAPVQPSNFIAMRVLHAACFSLVRTGKRRGVSNLETCTPTPPGIKPGHAWSSALRSVRSDAVQRLQDLQQPLWLGQW